MSDPALFEHQKFFHQAQEAVKKGDFSLAICSYYLGARLTRKETALSNSYLDYVLQVSNLIVTANDFAPENRRELNISSGIQFTRMAADLLPKGDMLRAQLLSKSFDIEDMKHRPASQVAAATSRGWTLG